VEPSEPPPGRTENELSGHVEGNAVLAGRIDSVAFNTTVSHTTVVNAAAPAARVPWQVPGLLPGFTNRTAELGRMRSALAGGGTGGAGAAGDDLRLLVLSGPPGVGKSALSHRFARDTRDEFPDGQLYADLAAYRVPGGGVDLGDVLGGFLRGLGVPAEEIAPSPAERAAQFRTRTSRTRMLMVIDDAEYAEQVRALLPGGSGTVLVTSHWRLEELRGAGALAVAVEPLSPAEGAALIIGQLGPRAAAEPEAVEALVELCGGLPVALRAVCALLERRSGRTLAETAARLRDEASRLDRLAGPTAVFDAAYGALPEPAAAVYRLLGVMPGPDAGLGALAAAMNASPDDVEDALDKLLSTTLVTERPGGRYAMHSLVRLHAHGVARRDEGAQWCADTVRRVVEWYRDCGLYADRVLHPARLRIVDQPDSGYPAELRGRPAPIAFADDAAALAWLETERLALLGCLRAAADCGWDREVWLLCDPLWALYQNHKHYADWIESHRLGAEASARAGAGHVRVKLLTQIARAHIELSEFPQAFTVLEEALELSRALGSRRLESSVLEFIGKTHSDQGAYADAIANFDAALRIADELRATTDMHRSTVILVYLTAQAHDASGHAELALPLLERARELSADPRIDGRMRGRVLATSALAYLHTGDTVRAAEAAERAVADARRRAVPLEEARILELLAEIAETAGDQAAMREAAAAAERIYREQGSPKATVVAERWLTA
jgi:tetratricopeptide (TPR) repeat protein